VAISPRKEVQMADIPDGVDYNVARLAIAWEMVKLTLTASSAFKAASNDERIKMLADAYAEAKKAVGIQ
jgi:hypothetical protein